MLTLGFLALLVALVLLVILFLLGRMWTLEVAFVRLAWIPLAALALQVILSRPRLLWSTLVAGMPGALLIVYLVVSLASFLVRD